MDFALSPLRLVPLWAGVLGNKLIKVKLHRLEQRSRDTGSHLIFVISVIKPYLVVGFYDLFQPDQFYDSGIQTLELQCEN